jgi:hypothetical protein
MKKSDEEFAQEAKALFDGSVDKLDAATLSTLNQGRHRALEAARSPRGEWMRWAPAAGVATAVLIAVMVTLPGTSPVEVMPEAMTDIDILLGEDSIDMYEDLEFYSWLDVADEGDDVG